MLRAVDRLVRSRWRDGWVRDAYADFNALTLEIAIEALFGAGQGSSAQALASAEITGGCYRARTAGWQQRGSSPGTCARAGPGRRQARRWAGLLSLGLRLEGAGRACAGLGAAIVFDSKPEPAKLHPPLLVRAAVCLPTSPTPQTPTHLTPKPQLLPCQAPSRTRLASLRGAAPRRWRSQSERRGAAASKTNTQRLSCACCWPPAGQPPPPLPCADPQRGPQSGCRWVPTPDNLGFNAAVARLDRAVYGLISERRRELAALAEASTAATPGQQAQQGGSGGEQPAAQPPRDLLDALLLAAGEGGERMGDRAARDELMTLLIAGQETSAILLGWACAYLAHHPGAQDAAAAEVRALLRRRSGAAGGASEPSSGGSDGEAASCGGRRLEPADSRRLPYLEAVVLEAMR